MASESHTTVSPSRRHGTRPFGEKPRNVAQFEPAAKTCSRSSKATPSSVSSSQGRSDQDE